MPFNPQFTITAKLASTLMQIEASRQAIEHLPITPTVLATLRETARLYSTHYSTMIEGNRLTQEQVAQVIEEQIHFPGRERDEKEILGYYAALELLEEMVASAKSVTEQQIKTLHGLVMAGGRKRVKATAYRDGQNVIRDSRSGGIVYMPPEAKDVPQLMSELVHWFGDTSSTDLPCPIRAAIAHYQFATIHPYYDGNGRTARLLTTLVLHLGSFGLKGLYSLEEYYARDLNSYYEALTIGPSHNYYLGRAEADITKFVEYFCTGMQESFAKVQTLAEQEARRGSKDRTATLKQLDPRQRKVLGLCRKKPTITSRDIEALFSVSQRTARHLLAGWVVDGFVEVLDASKKSRSYGLSSSFQHLID